MINLPDAANGLFGAWRLLHFDRSGLQYFRVTPDAFWNSFWAALVVIPGEIITGLLIAGSMGTGIPSADPIHTLLVLSGIYGILWLFFALVMAGVCEAVQRGERFVLFIVAWNWSHIVRLAIVMPAGILLALQASPPDGGWAGPVYLVALGATLVYAGFVARATLDTTVRLAVIVVVLETVLAFLFGQGARAMLS